MAGGGERRTRAMRRPEDANISSAMTAFAQALEEQRMEEAKDLAGKIDPNSVLNHTFGSRHYYAIRCTECPSSYKHPALTVTIQAGLEKAVRSRTNMEAWMSGEDAVLDLAKLLIERGAKVNATGTEEQNCESAGCPSVHGKTALCAAIQRGSPKLVKLLLDAHADANHKHKYDESAWGPDTRNPFGPGVLKPESWLSSPSNGSVCRPDGNDPRNANSEEILTMLRAAGATGPSLDELVERGLLQPDEVRAATPQQPAYQAPQQQQQQQQQQQVRACLSARAARVNEECTRGLRAGLGRLQCVRRGVSGVLGVTQCRRAGH